MLCKSEYLGLPAQGVLPFFPCRRIDRDDGENNKTRADASYNDMLESELSGEAENGRLVRLMIKLGFINERAE